MGWNTNNESSKHDPTLPFKDSTRGERLQRVMAAGGIASRRKCEEMIHAGNVKVNGILIDFLPAWVDTTKDRITIADRRLNLHSDKVYMMYNKPRGIVCTMSDPEGRQCIGDLISHHSGTRIFPVGRLDMESQGFLLLTNDSIFANELTHPRHGISKTYEVTVRGKIDEDKISKLQKGIFLVDSHTRHDNSRKGKRAKIENLELIRHDRDRTLLKITLAEGRNRQIRRMLATIGHPVKRLRRTHIGSVALKGLRPGQWRDLTLQEVNSLQHSIRRQSTL
ncbi:MAG: pseudouridine synthase [Phycisphaerales bacterium]|jgi:pseudouridine synthase|nr:pseudouridine synthase [Phycisphaerales bacterium]